MLRILITGIPGTGKTTLGGHMASTRGALHVDLEDEATRNRLQADPDAFVATLPERVVATWGFHPLHDVTHVVYLKEQGFHLVWLDGDRPAALRTFIQRGTVPEPLFYLQLWNIESTHAVQRVQPHSVVAPFDDRGSFRPCEDLAVEILARAGQQ